MTGPMFKRIAERVEMDREEGDLAYLHALTLKLEFVTKVLVAGVVATLGDDSDRHRYSLEHRLVRADSLGEWVDVLNSALTGPAAQFFLPSVIAVTRDLTERVGDADWRFDAVGKIASALSVLIQDQPQSAKVALRQYFQLVVTLRNRTRGHGATTVQQCADICPLLNSSLEQIISRTALFQLPWAYLHRNLSGKYRISPLLGDCACFDHLKRTRDVSLPSGIFVWIDGVGPRHVPLVFGDPDVKEIFIPNGNFRNKSFEVLSYVSNATEKRDGSPWLDPPGRLPPSETEGRTALEPVGNTFANLPPSPVGHVPRTGLEARVLEELLLVDRHPIVTLAGPGGIGKTTVALAAVNAVARMANPPYSVILWMSARDIDLLDSGPKPVAPKVVRRQDISRAAVELLEPAERLRPGFQSDAYFQQILTKGAAGPTLVILDNFETVESPPDVFSWVDAHVRHPNKVLITTRSREFAGDYPIEVAGMTDDEAVRLIDQEAVRLGIVNLLSSAYKEEVISESGGHPYVIKMFLGRVARERREVKPERIVATADQLLTALFERTFDSLTPAAQRIFLLLCSWRVFVPTIAVEAVALRPGNERFNVAGALAELRRCSLTEELVSEGDGETFVGVPLTASNYGRRKLDVSRFSLVVEEDRKLLMEFGAGKREDASRGVIPRIDRLVRAVAQRASESPSSLESFMPILEYLASRVPSTYLKMADLTVETYGEVAAADQAKRYLRRFLEAADLHEREKVWVRLADLCHATGDSIGVIHALSQAAILPTVTKESLATFANRVNNEAKDLKARGQPLAAGEVRLLVERMAGVLDRYIDQLSATDCSRLAWLYLNAGREDRARDVAQRGLSKDGTNEYCLNLVRKLDS